uniref:BRCA1-associated RING domain protein 1 n=1 Tax=Lygus hesperus TaxID=30085 RepID=A0A0A9W649_LYGHE
MSELENIICCKCLNVLPDYVIFPCGHFVCRSCEDIANCLICGQPVCLIKDSFSLSCYRASVAEGLYTPISEKTLPKKELPETSESPAASKTKSTSKKRKKPQKKSSSPEDESTGTPGAARCSPRIRKKLVKRGSSGQDKVKPTPPSKTSVRTRSRGSTEQVMESNLPSASTVNRTPKPSGVPMKARSLKNCLSASKSQLQIAQNADHTLNDIGIDTDISPPMKKRKNRPPRVSLRRISLLTKKRHIDSSDEDDGVFINSDSIVSYGKKVVVAQVHADPCCSSASSVNNSQTADETINYTQVGLGHLDRDEEQDNLDTSSLRTPVKTYEVKGQKMPGNVNLLSSPFFTNVSPGEFAGFEDGSNMRKRENDTVDDEYIIKSTVTPVDNSTHNHGWTTPKVKTYERIKSYDAYGNHNDFDTKKLIKGTLRSAFQSNIVTSDEPNTSQRSTMSIIETDTVVHSKAAHRPQSDKNVISNSIYSEDTIERVDDAPMELSSSCMDEESLHPDGELSDDDRKNLPCNAETDERDDFTDKTHHPQREVKLEREILAHTKEFDFPVNNDSSNSSDFSVKFKKRSFTMYDEPEEPIGARIEQKRSSGCSDGSTSESLDPQPDVDPPENSPPQGNVMELPVDDELNCRAPKRSYTVYDEPEEPSGFELAETSAPKCLEDRSSLPTTNNISSDLHTEPDVESLKNVQLQTGATDQPAEPSCHNTSNSLVNCTKSSYKINYEASEPSSITTNVVSPDSLHPQPDAGPSKDILPRANRIDLPDIHTSNDAFKVPKNSYARKLTFDEDSEPPCVSFADKRPSFNAGEVGEVLTATDSPITTPKRSSKCLDGGKPESLNPQPDVGPSNDILPQANRIDLPDIHASNDATDSTAKVPKKPYPLFAEDSKSSCFSFEEKLSSFTARDHVLILTTTEGSSAESLHPNSDVGRSEGSLDSQAAEDLPISSSHDGPPDFTVKTPKTSLEVLSNKLPDRLSFVRNIFNYRRDQENINITNVSSSESTYQPEACAIAIATSTSGTTQSEVPLSEPTLKESKGVGSSHEIPDNHPPGTTLMDVSQSRWHDTYRLLSTSISKLYLSERPKSLFRMAFDVLLLPMKNEEVFQGLSAISPITASAEKSVQVDLFLDQTTVKLEVGKDLVKRNSFTRRQLSFVPENSTPHQTSEVMNADEHLEPEESEDIVEGTPTKAQLVRVNLLADSTVCSPLSRTVNREESPAPLPIRDDVAPIEPAFSIFDPPPHNGEKQTENLAHNQSVSHTAVPPSPKNSHNPKPSLASPRKRVFSKVEGTAEQIENLIPSGPSSSKPISQPMDSSLDSESIIGDSEQILKRRKSHLALPLGRNNQCLKRGVEEKIIRPIPFRDISNVYQVATSGIYDIVEKNAIRKLCSLIKATFSSQLTKETTHLILPDGDDVPVTTKFLMALYNGTHILPMRWVFDCIISKSILPEADYYFKHPGIHRRTLMPRRTSLFEHFAFYICPEVGKDEVNHQALKDLMKFCNCNMVDTAEEICQASFRFRAVALRGADFQNPPHSKGHQIVQVSYRWFYSCLSSYQIRPFDNYD